jgi:CRP-like cAMP-binding protein
MEDFERLRTLVPISELPAHLQDQLFAQAETVEHKKKSVIFREGDRDNITYYLLEGDIELQSKGQAPRKMNGYDASARYPLARLQPRQMTAVALTPIVVLAVDNRLLDNLMALARTPGAGKMDATHSGMEVEEVDWLAVLLSSELFKRIPPSNVEAMFDTLEPVSFDSGQDVVRQGDPGDYYYIIQSGVAEVVRRVPDGTEIKLAELYPGDVFGEEALVTSSKRNATVRMVTHGELARLTRDDFIRLIRQPVLRSLTVEEANQRLRDGESVAIDVRFPSEHAESGLPGSLNIPVGQIRVRAPEELDKDQEYLVYCDNGGRSSAATFILTQLGYTARYVDGGLVAGVVKTATASPAPSAAQAQAQARAADPLEANVRASLLSTELAQADQRLESLERVRPTTADNPAESERFNKLAGEMGELKRQLEAAKARADAEADAARRAQEERIRQIEDEAARRAQQSERALEDVYQKNAEEMDKVQQLKAKIEAQLIKERERMASEAASSQLRMAEAERMRQEAETAMRTQQEREEQMRQEIAQQMQEERRKLDESMAQATMLAEMELQEAQQAKEEAERARLGAAAEAQRAREEAEAARKVAEEVARRAMEEAAAAKQGAVAEARRAQQEAETARQAAEAAARHAKEEAEAARQCAEEATRRAREEAEAARQDAATVAQRAREEAAMAAHHAQEAAEAARQAAVADAQHARAEAEAARREAAVAAQRAQEEAAAAKGAATAASQQIIQEAESSLREQQQREQDLRRRIATQLSAERRKLEESLAHAAEMTQKAMQERQEAAAAKKGATLEAQRIIEEFKASQEARRAVEEARFEAERQRLQNENDKIRHMMAEAEQAKQAAQGTLREVEKKAAQLRQASQTANVSGPQAEYKTQMREMQIQAETAAKRLEEAMAEEAKAQIRAKENAKRLQLSQEEELRIASELQAELESWVKEQDIAQSTTAHREVLEEQRKKMDRIRARAEEAKKSKQAHTQSLLDDIALQLDTDDQ